MDFHTDDPVLELTQKIEKAKLERDAWQKTSPHRFQAASIMVTTLERELGKLLEAKRE